MELLIRAGHAVLGNIDRASLGFLPSLSGGQVMLGALALLTLLFLGSMSVFHTVYDGPSEVLASDR